MIFVQATVQVNSGYREAFLSELQMIVETVRAEPGCLEYTPSIEVESRIPVQAEPRKDAVTIFEKWTGIDALAQHLSTAHMVAYRERVRDYVKWVDLRIMEPA